MAGEDPGMGQPQATDVSRTSQSAAYPADEGAHAGLHRRHRRRWLAALVLLLIVGILIALLMHRSAPPRPPAPAAISVAQARSGDMNVYVYALGTVTPLYTVTVYSQVTGRIMAVHYREGQMVQQGGALVDIDPRPYQSMLQQAEGTLKRDMGALAEARIDLQRYQAAYARNAIAKQQLDDQAQTVVQDEGTVEADQGSVAYERVQLEYCHIVSPISGRVGLRLVDPGNTVFAGSSATLVVVTQLQPITVVFDVSEDDLPRVQAQLQSARALTVDVFDRSDEHQLDSGTLTAYDNEVDTTTGTVRFRARLPNLKLGLFPNQFVNARLLLQTLHQVTLVPSAAVQYDGTSAFVYLLQSNGTVAVHPVTVVASDDQNSAVRGLSTGSSVATSGFERIENGARVAVEPAAPASTGNAQAGGAAAGNGMAGTTR
jgi:multidrug efflux system membrane fusion protein